jgi:hypothetical protein
MNQQNCRRKAKRGRKEGPEAKEEGEMKAQQVHSQKRFGSRGGHAEPWVMGIPPTE